MLNKPSFTLFYLIILSLPGNFGNAFSIPCFNSYEHGNDDSLALRQYLYNGRVWRDIYSHKVEGDPYLYAAEFLPGSVAFNGRSFKNLKLRYDILNDEIMILTDRGNIIRLNKEMVDSFDLIYDNSIHTFKNSEPDSLNLIQGYVEILYKSNTSIYVKYIKKISRLSQGRTYDVFEETQRIYLLKDGTLHRISSKKEFFTLLDDRKPQIASFIRAGKIRVSKKVPESFVTVLKYYDSLR